MAQTQRSASWGLPQHRQPSPSHTPPFLQGFLDHTPYAPKDLSLPVPCLHDPCPTITCCLSHQRPHFHDTPSAEQLPDRPASVDIHSPLFPPQAQSPSAQTLRSDTGQVSPHPREPEGYSLCLRGLGHPCCRKDLPKAQLVSCDTP